MPTAVVGPIVNVPSLHFTSSADTGSDGLVSSSLNLLCCVHVCASQTHHNPVGSGSEEEAVNSNKARLTSTVQQRMPQCSIVVHDYHLWFRKQYFFFLIT